MESRPRASGIMRFFKQSGFDDRSIQDMYKRCEWLEAVEGERASETWEYLKNIGLTEWNIRFIIRKCPRILALDLHEKLVPMIQCLATLETRPKEVASAIKRFPDILLHSLEEKLCPLLAFFEALGAPEKQLGKMILLNPRIVSYSIESKLSQMVVFLAGLGLSENGMIGRFLVEHPFIMRYSVENRLRPTSEFLRSLGLTESQLQKVAITFPEVICRDVNKILRPNVRYLESCGLSSSQIAAVVGGYPPVVIRSVSSFLGPRIKFLEQVMGRRIQEVTEYPEFFKHGKTRLDMRQKLLTRKSMECSLSEMLSCKQKRFTLRCLDQTQC